MGMLADVFAAAQQELTSEIAKHGPTNRLPTVDSQGFDWNTIPRFLQIVLRISEADASRMFEDCLSRALHYRDLRASIVPLPAALLQALANADRAELRRIRLAYWNETEEQLQADPLADTPVWFDELASLAREARESQRQLYVWWR